MPTNVTNNEMIIAKIIDWATYNEATFSFFSPMEFPISVLVPAPTPTPICDYNKINWKRFC